MDASMNEPASASVASTALSGLDAHLVEIRAELHDPNATAPAAWPGSGDRELGERVRAAIRNTGYLWPPRRVRLILPARPDSGHDLAAALAVLVASGHLPHRVVQGAVVVGELGLDGSLRPVPGVLPALLAAHAAGITRAIVPRACQHEAELVTGLHVIAADTVAELTALLTTSDRTTAVTVDQTDARPNASAMLDDLADVPCPPAARRALLIAAAGGHPIQLTGPGAVMLARRLPDLLPPLTGGQALEVTAIHSIAGRLSPQSPLIITPPYIAPHPSMSLAGFIGGGPGGRPGALARACHGVLHLEEVEDFSPSHLEALRAAFDDAEIRLTRRDVIARYPTRFLLVLTRQNPNTHHRVPGMLLDRIPIRVHLPTTPPTDTTERLDTAITHQQVIQARKWASARWASLTGTPATNATVGPEHLRQAKSLPSGTHTRLGQLLRRGVLSQRGAQDVTRVAWTIADLDQTAHPHRGQVDEALALRGVPPAGLDHL